MNQNMACIPVVATTTAYSVGCIQIPVASRDDVMMSNVVLQVCLSSCRQQVKKG